MLRNPRARAASRMLILAVVVGGMLQCLRAAEDAGWAGTALPFFQTYCWECHGKQRQKGELDLQSVASSADLGAKEGLAAELAKRLAQEEMPPAKARQPTALERSAMVSWLGGVMRGGSLEGA